MPKSAITKNNAGIIEAIKRNSGSTKFYKPSFEGIIQAIQDWNGGGSGGGSGGGTNVLPGGGSLPDTDNTEGDLVVIPNGEGDYFMYVFANGAWERLHVTTEEVEVAGSAPFTIELPDGTVLKNQANINAYLDERITALSEKGYDDTGIRAELAQEIVDREAGDQALQDQIDALEAYDDTGIKADLAQEILDREAGDQALHDKIDALHAPDRPDPSVVRRFYRISRYDINSGDLYVTSLNSASAGKILVHEEDLLSQPAPSMAKDDQIKLESESGQSYLYDITAVNPTSNSPWIEYSITPVEIDSADFVDKAPYVVTFYIYPANLTNRILEGEQKQSEIIDTVQSALTIQESIIERVEELPTWVSDIPPVDKNDGDLWFDSGDTAQLYVRYGGEWVVACPPVTDDNVSGAISDVEAVANEAVQKANLVQFQLDQNVEFVRWDQERQDEKIAELEGEVDDLKPSIERGEWTYNVSPESSNNPIAGEYHAYAIIDDEYCKQQLAECYAEANKGDTPQEDATACNRQNTECQDKIGEINTDVPWHTVQWLVMARTDDSGRTHDFGDVVPGMYVEAINLDGSGHGLYVIQSKSVTLGRAGLEVEPVHSTGHPNGKAVIKIFKMAEAANPEDYVRKDGDEMTGTLKIETAEDITAGNVLRIKAGRGLAVNQNIFDVRDGANNQLFWIDSKDIGTKVGYTPTKVEHVVNKQYVDDQIQAMLATAIKPGPCVFKWKYKGDVAIRDLEAGEFCGPSNPTFNNGQNHTYAFHKKSLTLNMEFYKTYDQYFKMGHIWASIWYFTDTTWKCKGTMSIRDIYWQDSRNSDCFAIKTHTDLDDGHTKLMGTLTTNTNYWLTISGIL